MTTAKVVKMAVPANFQQQRKVPFQKSNSVLSTLLISVGNLEQKIGLAFSGQLNKRELPVSEFDYKLDAVVTEEDIFIF